MQFRKMPNGINTDEDYKGRKIDDVIQYIKDHLKKFPGEPYHIFIGCDSQDTSRSSVYATAIVIHRVGKGAHVIYTRDRVKKIKDTYLRLWGEPERAVVVAELLRTGGIEKLILPFQPEGLTIDLDFNGDPKWLSNKVLAGAKGYIVGLGFECRIKPDGWSATYAANKLCR